MPTPEQIAYARKLEEISDRFIKLEDSTIKAAVNQLQALRRDIAAELTLAEGFEAYRLRQLQTGIGRTIDQFEAQLSAQMRDNFGQIYELGGLSAVEPLQAVGLPAFYQPNMAQVNAVMDFSADLIQQIGSEMRGKINGQIRLAVLGERSPFQAMQMVTDVLGVKARDLRWGRLKRPEVVKGVAARAEAILRTEMTRVYGLAHHSQQLQTAQQIPDVQKSWVAAGDARTRDSHINAHFRYMNEPIPVSEPFLVGGFKLMFPGDPNGPAQETINCRCRSITAHPLVGRPELPIDREIEKERARREREKEEKVEKKAQRKPAPPAPPKRPIPQLEQDYAREVTDVQKAYNEARARGDTFEAEGIKPYLDELKKIHTDERDINQALWNQQGITPDQATQASWQLLANSLQAEGYDLYKKYSQEGIKLHVMEKRGAKDAGYADVGGKVVQVRKGRFSVREAQRIEGKMWKQAKEDLNGAYGRLLQQAGYKSSDIANANFEQRAKLLAELGGKEISRTKRGSISQIDDVPPDSRQVVVKTVDYDLAATCDLAARDPLATPTIDAYRKMQLADIIETTILGAE